MIRTVAACLITAVLVALGLYLAAPTSSGQRIYSASPVGAWWPPHPRDQVHLYEYGASLQPGEEKTIYTVPNDRWLVLVPARMPDCTSGAVFPGVGLLAQDALVQLIESSNGQLAEKCRSAGGQATNLWVGPDFSAGVGWRFAPGSNVVIKNTASSTVGVSYSMFGYLAAL